jgi:chitinase
MPGVDSDTLTQIMEMKSHNPNVKMMISLGGWSFNDNGTDTQPVYSDMVSTSAKRAQFIDNLFSFLMQYGLDGVDFDWECKLSLMQL